MDLRMIPYTTSVQIYDNSSLNVQHENGITTLKKRQNTLNGKSFTSDDQSWWLYLGT